jgi:hypothetical protein
MRLRGRCDETSTRRVSHPVLAIYIKKHHRAKEEDFDHYGLDGNSSISPCKNIIFKKSSKPNPKSFKIL